MYKAEEIAFGSVGERKSECCAMFLKQAFALTLLSGEIIIINN